MQNQKYFRAHIYYFRHFQDKKTLKLNSPYQMKLFDIKISTVLVAENGVNDIFLFTLGIQQLSLSSLKPRIKKIKFWIKIDFCWNFKN